MKRSHLRRLTFSLPVLLVLTACGNSNPDGAAAHVSADLGVVEQSPTVVTSQWTPLLYSDAYSGLLALTFAEGTGVQWEGDTLSSRTGLSLAGIQQLLASVPGLHVIRRLGARTDASFAALRAQAASRGIPLPDWSLSYRLVVPDPTQAERLLAALDGHPAVRYIHPLLKVVPIGAVTPDLLPQQGYLQLEGGLNVPAAWAAGYTGSGVQVVDIELYWNTSHEDLAVGPEDYLLPTMAPYLEVASADPSAQHGTAILGFIGGKDNDTGVKGIAHGATLHMAQVKDGGNFWETLAPLVNGLVDYQLGEDPSPQMHPGAILVVAVGLQCLKEIGGETKKVGCLPIEAQKDGFELLEAAVKSGMVVIEGAANWNYNFDTYGPFLTANGIDLGKSSSGALMVGASTGADMTKLSMTNCGKRVEVYAWGQNAVTTGYGDLGFGADPNQWYTALPAMALTGTSAATAQIAGVAALLQEYVQTMYGPQIKPSQGVYLNTAQMRDVLVQSGAGHEAKDTNGCPIGVQPDVGKALQLLQDGVVKPTIYDRPVNACEVEGWCDTIPKQSALSKPMDLDGDQRGDLIAFSRDHQWYVDLSGEGSGGDNYGAWDLIATPDTLPDGIYFPVVGDYNTDGQADLAMYNSTKGLWYIRFTDAEFLKTGQWENPDKIKILDYHTDPNWRPYSRPVPGDYDGADTKEVTFDRWLDPAIMTPDGTLLIDFTDETEGTFTGTKVCNFDEVEVLLSPNQLKMAPGWAYLPFSEGFADLLDPTYYAYKSHIAVASPPSEKIKNDTPTTDDDTVVYPDCSAEDSVDSEFQSDCLGVDYPWNVPADVKKVPVGSAVVVRQTGWGESISALLEPQVLTQKQADGKWIQLREGVVNAAGEEIWGYQIDAKDFGGLDCYPIAADYEAKAGTEPELDRAVLCRDGWRVEYSDGTFPVDADGLRHVPFPADAVPLDPLPGYVYPGGVAYAELRDIYEYYLKQIGCTHADGTPCTLFDLTTTPQVSDLTKTYPPPIGPYVPVCLKYWSTHPLECLSH